VTRPHAATIDVLALDPLRVTQSIHAGPVPTRVIVSPARPWCYVTAQFAETVEIVDLDRGARIGSIPMPGHSLGAAIAPDGRTLFVVTNQDRLLAIASLRRAVIATTSIPLACPHLAVHPSGRWVFVPCWRAGVILEVDAHTLATTRRFEVEGVVQDVVVSSDGQSLYAANERGWLDAIHLPTGKRRTVQLGTGALGLALSPAPDNSHLFVSLFTAGRVLVLHRASLHEAAVVATGGRPQRIAVNAQGAVLVANEAGWVDSLQGPGV
jgi:DNA-binding beta-propeller fold protein YncE